jgi:hypothetical protein
MRTKEIAYTVIVFTLVFSAVISLIHLQRYIGFAVTTPAGSVTELFIFMQEETEYWHGFNGYAIMFPAASGLQSALAPGGDVNLIHLLFGCMEPGIYHEVYATTTEYPDWDSADAATAADIDAYLGINASVFSSAANTFTENITLELGSRSITAPGTYTKNLDSDNATFYNLAVLKDNLGNLIFATQVTSNTIGYANQENNYQLMVPSPNGTSPRYYFFTDPYDDCPQGMDVGLIGGRGYVYGWVTDNETREFLEDALVMMGDNQTLTNITGFFNMSVNVGYQVIAATKTGYRTYISLDNISAGDGTEHNISMAEFEEFLYETEAVGPGIGPGDDIGPGIGQGVGPGVSYEEDVGPYTEEPKKIEGLDIWISTTTLDKVMRQGTFLEELVRIYNFKDEQLSLDFKVEGNVTRSIQLDKTSLVVLPERGGNLTVTFFGNQELGTYTGSLKLGGDINFTLPITLKIVSEDMLPVEALLLDVVPSERKIQPGKTLRYKVDLKNMLTDQDYDVILRYFVKDINNTKVFARDEDKVHLKTTYSLFKEFPVPQNFTTGNYLIQVDAYYLGLITTGTALFDVVLPFYKYRLFGVLAIWTLLPILLGILALIALIWYIRREIERRKRFHVRVEYDLLPQQGPRAIKVGKIAETNKDVYFDMDNLTVHTIVAGSTGGGKTISGQVMIEECLMKNVAVIVFDPTAQWSGYLRKCTDKKMMGHYARFGLKKKEARNFPGNIRFVENPYEIIDVKKYLTPGTIQVFTLNKLDPKDIDIFVANTVREVFHMNLQEARELKLMLVYDEVHRLLPKFGGSGEGFIQIERACREFRKWGVGVMLISQVLADFVGQIKANINTEIQMKTRDEGDLNRIETKFGKGLIQSLVKSPVGSGMVQNAAYNRGNPFFVEFRPILHSVERLTDEELERYNKYNRDIDDIEYQIDQLEKNKIDVFDLRLELKLAKDKLQTGNFNMVDIYLEGLRPRIHKDFDKLGIKPAKREIKLVDKAALEEELKRAKEARQKYEGGMKREAGPVKRSGPLKFDQDVPPDKILKLKNDMLVVNLKGLIDEVAAMKPEHYRQHVDEKHNDFADWIETVIKRKGLARKVRETPGKAALVKLLEESYEKSKQSDEEEGGDDEKKEEPPRKEEPPDEEKPDQEAPPQAQAAAETHEQAAGKGARLVLAFEKQGAKATDTGAKQESPLQSKAQSAQAAEVGTHKSADVLLAETSKYVSEGNLENATKAYEALTKAYKTLPGTEKQAIAEACVELSKKISVLKKQGSPQATAIVPGPAEEISQLLPKAEEYVREGKKDLAMQAYQRIMRDYKELPEDQKQAIYQKCDDLYAKLTAIA